MTYGSFFKLVQMSCYQKYIESNTGGGGGGGGGGTR